MYIVYIGYMKQQKANSSMYPSYSLDLDLVREAIGVHLEEFLVVTCRPGTPSKMLKHTSPFCSHVTQSWGSLLLRTLRSNSTHPVHVCQLQITLH